MNRRTFLVRSSLVATAGFLSRPPIFAQPPTAGSGSSAPKSGPAPATPEFKTLRGDVGYFTARGGTIGWLANKDALAAVDTQFPDTAKLFLDSLPGRSGRKLDLVINTHHHGDHTGGNSVFKPEAKMIVAQANVPALQRAAAERAEKAGNTQPWAKVDAQVYADTTFPESWRKDIGSEIVSTKYFGAGHTNGDIVTHFEKANVVHMGDLVFNRIYPVIDRPGGASIRHWIVVLETVVKNYPADAVYIFGHGNAKFGVTGKRDEMLVLRDYFSALLDYTQKKIAAGEPKEKIVTLENMPGFPDFHAPMGPQNRLPLNLGVAFDELTAKTSTG